jgi:hypothetical protein
MALIRTPLQLEDWKSSYAEYIFIRSTEGTPSIYSKNPKERELAGWAIKQRNLHRKDSLYPLHKIILFEDTEWVENYSNSELQVVNFESKMRELREYIRANDMQLPAPYGKGTKDSSFCRWIGKINLEKDRGTLQQFKIQLLEQNTWWTWHDREAYQKEKYEKMMRKEKYQYLVAFCQENSRFPTDEESGVSSKFHLGQWAHGLDEMKERITDGEIGTIRLIIGDFYY